MVIIKQNYQINYQDVVKQIYILGIAVHLGIKNPKIKQTYA